MKLYAIIIALICAVALGATAEDVAWRKCVLYYYHENVSTNVPALSEIVELEKPARAPLALTWKIPNPPSKAELKALNAAAIAWYPGWCKDVACDYALWENEKLRAVIKLMVIEINKLRQNAGLPTYDKAQVEAALAAEM